MQREKPLILLVDDDTDIIEFLSYSLKQNDFLVESVYNGLDAITKAKEIIPDIILLDVMMPKMDGMETCSNLRNIKELNDTMIVFLTARGEDYSQIDGFERGADDYIAKPIQPKVLVSRLKAILKRQRSAEEGNKAIISFDNITINTESCEVKVDNNEVHLSKKELELLLLLISKPDKLFSREDIFSKIWGEDIVVGERTIDVHIRHLREKLKTDKIKTYKGIGYKFQKK
jgi:two-component system alkaline phosphatase synthesis response regulator PhoP